MIRFALLALLLAAPTPPSPPVLPAALAPLLDTSSDRLVSRAFVPSARRKVGEVRTLRRRGAVVVQTLLYTRILKRVTAEIRLREEASWPPGHPQHADAERYLAALDAARKEAWHLRPKGRRADRRQRVWIEFVRTDQQSAVFVGTFTSKDHRDGIEVLARSLLAALPLSRAYVERDMRLIVASAHGVAEEHAGDIDPALAGGE